MESDDRFINCTARDIIRADSRNYILKLWIFIAAGLLMMAVAGILPDIRFAIVGLMVIFLILPISVQISVFRALGSKWANINLTPKEVEIDGEGIKLTPAEGFRLAASEIKWDDVETVGLQRKNYVLVIKGRPSGLLLLPSERLNDNQKTILEKKIAERDSMAGSNG